MKELISLEKGDIVYLMKWEKNILKNETLDDIKVKGVQELKVLGKFTLPTGAQLFLNKNEIYSLPHTISVREGELCKLYIYVAQGAVNFYTTNVDTWKEDFKAAYEVRLQELREQHQAELDSYDKVFNIVIGE